MWKACIDDALIRLAIAGGLCDWGMVSEVRHGGVSLALARDFACMELAHMDADDPCFASVSAVALCTQTGCEL